MKMKVHKQYLEKANAKLNCKKKTQQIIYTIHVSFEWSSELQENQTENFMKSISTAIIGFNVKIFNLNPYMYLIV